MSPASGTANSQPRSSTVRAAGKRPALLERYTSVEGDAREIVALRLRDKAILVIDCAAGTRANPCLVGRIEPDEPVENAPLLARLYLAEERPRCRRLRHSDL